MHIIGIFSEMHYVIGIFREIHIVGNFRKVQIMHNFNFLIFFLIFLARTIQYLGTVPYPKIII